MAREPRPRPRPRPRQRTPWILNLRDTRMTGPSNSHAKASPSELKPAHMLLSPFRRRRRQCWSWVRLVFVFLFVLFVCDALLTITSNPPLTRVSPSTTGLGDRIFIASMHWNNEYIIRTHWSHAVLDLVKHFGPENTYVAIIESGSWDNTKDALRELDHELGKLGVERYIELSETTHKDEIERVPEQDQEGWIWTPRGRKELRRIPYLAGIRNRVMAKLKELAEKVGNGKRTFDKILWLNDVIFTTEDITTLLATRDGDYAAACSLDFSKPPKYYDTFALRDISGAKAATQIWPFFLSSVSRSALMSNAPVPVKSCWNGITVFQADPFYRDPPLQFRGIQDSLAAHHLEGSECCLIHTDNELTASRGVWLNPNVRVAYNAEADKVINPETGSWPSKQEKLKGIWSNRWARWTRFLSRFMESYVVNNRLRIWRYEVQKGTGQVREEAPFCLINEMQVLVENGWAHL